MMAAFLALPLCFVNHPDEVGFLDQCGCKSKNETRKM
tara:strand:+ start:16586 stop:16696 length:111 start_codon:yes stop_codon:yes gene_type:complete